MGNQVTHEEMLAIGKVAAITVCEFFGVDPVISYTQGIRMYGAFFRTMVKNKRLQPRNAGKGKTGKREYAIKDIIALKAEESAKATII